MVSVACFRVRVSVMFHFIHIFQSVWVAEWPFREELHARLAICSHCILFICNIYLFPVLVLGAGFCFLLQFLFIVFLFLHCTSTCRLTLPSFTCTEHYYLIKIHIIDCETTKLVCTKNCFSRGFISRI